MTERIIYAVLALALACLAGVFASGAYDAYAEHVRYRDFETWTQSSGNLKSLRLRQVVNKSARPYRIDCEYTFAFAGRSHSGTAFDLGNRLYSTADEAKVHVQSALGVADPSRWRAVQRDQLTDWVLDSADTAIPVRHSSKDPLGSALTSTPPPPEWLNWFLIAVLSAGALLTGLASPVMVAAIFLKGPKAPSAKELAMGDPNLPLVPFRLRDAYANLVDGALLAAQQLRDAEGPAERTEEVLRTLQAELGAARSDKMRQRRRSLKLRGQLDPGRDTPLRANCDDALRAVDDYVRMHLFVQDPDRRGES